MGKRLAVMFGAACVGALFAAGLFIHGRVGGALLLVVAAILATLTYATYQRIPRRRDVQLRLVIVVLILIVAVAKLVKG
jgi:4-hydroxybenzoate polyprenyltransferase